MVPVRKIMEAAGVKDVLAKSLGSSNRRNVAKATLNAFAKLRSAAIWRNFVVKQLKNLLGEQIMIELHNLNH